MLSSDVKVISVDDHLCEPRDLWERRLPARLQEAGPHVVETDGGSEQWCFEGVIAGPSGLSAVAGTDLKGRTMDPRRFDDMRPGCYDPVARLEDMDEDGVWAQLNFPQFPGFAGTRFLRAKDHELAHACLQAWNDYVFEEWCATSPDRLLPMILVPLWDPALAVAEIERCAPRGAKAITFPDTTDSLGLPSFHTDHWDAVWSAAEAAELPICMHFGTSGVPRAIAPDAPKMASTVIAGFTLFPSMSDLLCSPTLHRHPKLQIVYSEGGIGWMPYALERLDQVWEHYRFYDLEPRVDAEVRPSDLFREHVYGCFIDDRFGVENRHKVGVDRILFETDYPHADSLWPNSRKHVEEVLTDVPADEAKQMVHDNAVRLFRLSD
jgi:predicted TIM-barrel fold metal-dependent hydrolase